MVITGVLITSGCPFNGRVVSTGGGASVAWLTTRCADAEVDMSRSYIVLCRVAGLGLEDLGRLNEDIVRLFTDYDHADVT